jgi:hypothetical protein
MKNSWKTLLSQALVEFTTFWQSVSMEQLRSFIEKFSMQICLLSFHHAAISMTEIAIENGILPNVVQQKMTF